MGNEPLLDGSNGDECCCLVLTTDTSSDIRRYACFSHRLFHAISSLTSSCHLLDTCEERASVLASSIKVRICQPCQHVNRFKVLKHSLPSSKARWVVHQTDPSLIVVRQSWQHSPTVFRRIMIRVQSGCACALRCPFLKTCSSYAWTSTPCLS